MKVTTTGYDQTHKTSVLELYEKSFQKELTKEVWSWRFEKYPFGNSMARVALFGDRLVGYYLLQPINIQLGNNLVKSLFSLNTMTDSDFSGKGIMTNLANEVYDVAKNEGYQIVIGFANENSRYMFTKKLGFKEVAILSEFSIDITNNLIQPSSCAILEINNFDESYFDFFRTSYEKISKAMIPRTPEYLNWRFLHNPENKYYCYKILKNNQFAGYFVLKNYEGKKGHIMDFLIIDDPEVYQAIMNHAIIFCQQNKINKLTLWINKTLPFYEYLNKIGFVEKKMENFFVLKNLTKTSHNFDLDNFNNWYITMSDSDVF